MKLHVADVPRSELCQQLYTVVLYRPVPWGDTFLRWKGHLKSLIFESLGSQPLNNLLML